MAPSTKAIYQRTSTAFGADYCMDQRAAAHTPEHSATEIATK